MRTKKPIQYKACMGAKHNGQLLPLNKFMKHQNNKDGHSNLCRECYNEKYNKSPKVQTMEKLDKINEGIKEINEKLDIILNK